MLPTPINAAKPFFIAKDYWQSAMQTIGAKAYDRLQVIHYSWQGFTTAYDEGRVLVSRPSDGVSEGSVIVLHPDFKRREDYDELLQKNMHLAAKYPNLIPLHTYSDRPTLYRRSGFRWLPPITCNCYYSPDWNDIADQGQAFDLGAISA